MSRIKYYIALIIWMSCMGVAYSQNTDTLNNCIHINRRYQDQMQKYVFKGLNVNPGCFAFSGSPAQSGQSSLWAELRRPLWAACLRICKLRCPALCKDLSQSEYTSHVANGLAVSLATCSLLAATWAISKESGGSLQRAAFRSRIAASSAFRSWPKIFHFIIKSDAT